MPAAAFTQRPWWPWAKRIVVVGFLLFVVTLISTGLSRPRSMTT